MNQVTDKLRDGFPWGNIRNKTVVDVGGGSGHIAMYLAAVSIPSIDLVIRSLSAVT